MTNLQKYITHSGDCSCYQVIIDNYGIVHDCDICDCGALREKIKLDINRNGYVDEIMTECWINHIISISRTHNK
jgi:hypothetical protein